MSCESEAAGIFPEASEAASEFEELLVVGFVVFDPGVEEIGPVVDDEEESKKPAGSDVTFALEELGFPDLESTLTGG